MPEIDHNFIALQNALLGRYSIERELGRGGMGVVYLARDVQLERPVAIKMLHERLARDTAARARFVEEARTAARLAHPHIVPIYAVEAREDLVYFVMALIDGETLGQRIRRRGALAADDAERMMREVAWALGYAHAHGVVHRDLTLENILLERSTGRALLADFGIATMRDNAEQTPTLGTPGYLAPEVIRGEPASTASDLYALGVVGYTALAGSGPFQGDTTAQLLARHLMQPVPPMPQPVRAASRRLSDAVMTCLAKDPEDRPASTALFHAMLDRVPEPVAIAPPLRHWFTRWTRIRAVYALAAPILATQTWLMIQGYFDSGLRVLLTAALVTTILTLTALPVAGQLVFEAAELRRLRQSGYGVDDIRAAFGHWQAEQVQERRAEGLAALPGRVIFDLTAVGVFAIVATFLIWPHVRAAATELPYIRDALIDLLSPVYMATLTGVGIGFLVPGHRARPDGWLAQAKRRFWESRLAGVIVALSSVGQRHRLTATATLHRNTEMVLGLAVDDLWKAIPADTRAGLGDVPTLAHTLQAGATELRALIERLGESEQALTEDTTELAGLASARATLEQQHRTTVTALEQVRLQLLRLLASQHQTVDLVEQLRVAREVEADLARHAAAHGAIRRLLQHTRTQVPITPRPTPTPA